MIESIVLGIPCITSATSAIFYPDPYLHERLVVNELDNLEIIHEHVERVFQEYDDVVIRCKGKTKENWFTQRTYWLY